MPSWLTMLLLAAGLLIGAAFLAEPVLVFRRRRQAAAGPPPGGRRDRPGTAAGAAAGTAAARAAAGSRDAACRGPGPASGGRAAGRGPDPIVIADYARLVVTRSVDDGTVYVLRPPRARSRGDLAGGPAGAARGTLSGAGRAAGAARQPGRSSWPTTTSWSSRAARARHGLRAAPSRPGSWTVLRAARLVLPEEPYEELAGVSRYRPAGRWRKDARGRPGGVTARPGPRRDRDPGDGAPGGGAAGCSGGVLFRSDSTSAATCRRSSGVSSSMLAISNSRSRSPGS